MKFRIPPLEAPYFSQTDARLLLERFANLLRAAAWTQRGAGAGCPAAGAVWLQVPAPC